MRELYEEMILDHNRNPHNFLRIPKGESCTARGFNPICGDEFNVYIKIEGHIIEDVSFDGAGCAISTASASMMTDAIKGKTVEEAQRLFRDMNRMLMSGEPLGDKYFKLSVLSGVREYPIRIKCATLAWHTMNAALEDSKELVTTE